MSIGEVYILAGAVLAGCTIFIVLEASSLMNLGVRDTVLELWQTYFGGDDSLPSGGEGANPLLENEDATPPHQTEAEK